MLKRGYFGIGVYHMKNIHNLGVLWRSAHNFGADFMFVIGKRYKIQASDTTKALRYIPFYEYLNYEEFKDNTPKGCQIVCIEQTEKSKCIYSFKHPERCIYLLGAEDSGLPEGIMENKQIIHIDTPMCINVSIAGSIVMFHRQLQIKDKG